MQVLGGTWSGSGGSQLGPRKVVGESQRGPKRVLGKSRWGPR